MIQSIHACAKVHGSAHKPSRWKTEPTERIMPHCTVEFQKRAETAGGGRPATGVECCLNAETVHGKPKGCSLRRGDMSASEKKNPEICVVLFC